MMTQPTMSDAEELTDDELDELLAYHEGRLAAPQVAQMQRRIATEARWANAAAELVATSPLAALAAPPAVRAPAAPPVAPAQFVQAVTSKLHERSGGRLFAPRWLLPLTLILLLACGLFLVLALGLRRSSTGALHAPDEQPAVQPAPAPVTP